MAFMDSTVAIVIILLDTKPYVETGFSNEGRYLGLKVPLLYKCKIWSLEKTFANPLSPPVVKL